MPKPELVRDNAALHRYELTLGGGIAFIDYRDHDGIRALMHAEVPVALRGTGVAQRLTSGALELARAARLKVLPRCSYIVSFMQRHPEFNDLRASA